MTNKIDSKDVNKFYVYIDLASYLQSIKKSLSEGYVYYVTGQIPIETAPKVLLKLDGLYYINQSTDDQINHNNFNSEVTIKLFGDYHWHKIGFILMAKPSINNSFENLFFKREKYKNALNDGLIVQGLHFRKVINSDNDFECNLDIPDREINSEQKIIKQSINDFSSQLYKKWFKDWKLYE